MTWYATSFFLKFHSVVLTNGEKQDHAGVRMILTVRTIFWTIFLIFLSFLLLVLVEFVFGTDGWQKRVAVGLSDCVHSAQSSEVQRPRPPVEMHCQECATPGFAPWSPCQCCTKSFQEGRQLPSQACFLSVVGFSLFLALHFKRKNTCRQLCLYFNGSKGYQLTPWECKI